VGWWWIYTRAFQLLEGLGHSVVFKTLISYLEQDVSVLSSFRYSVLSQHTYALNQFGNPCLFLVFFALQLP
jgi:hypothetical protein